MSQFPFDPSSPLHVRLYGRAGCPQCKEAARLLAAMRDEFDFWIERVDVEADLALRAQLKGQVPVVTFNGAGRVQMPITPDKLRRAFKKALRVEAKDRRAFGAGDRGARLATAMVIF